MFYLLFFIGIIFLLYLNNRNKTKFCYCCFNNIKINAIVNLCVLLLLAILAGGRDITVGTDVLAYGVNIFNYNSRYKDLIEFYDNHILEIGYELENYIVTRFTNDIHYFFLFCSATVMFGLYFGANFWSKKLGIPFPLIILFFLLTGCFNTSLNIMRQYMAVTTIFGFSKFLFERKFFISCIGIFLAFSFHHSALIGFLIYFILYNKYNKLFVIGIFCCFVLLPVVSNLLINFNVLPARFTRYFSENPPELHEKIFDLSKLIFPVMAIAFYLKKKSFIGLFFLKVASLDFLFSSMYFLFGALGRLSIYFQIFDVVLLAVFVNKYFSKTTNRTILTIAMIFIYSLLFYYKFVIQNNAETYPYSWTWGLFA